MAGKTKSETTEKPALPELRELRMSEILEPEIPARAQMSDEKMRELQESMRELGLIEPITVRREKEMYEIVTGHRRWFAARALRWQTIRAILLPDDNSDTLAIRLHENIIREDLNPAEEAIFFAEVREKYQLDEEGLCHTLKRNADYIAGRFALLRGDPEVFAALQKSEIGVGVAHELNRCKDQLMRHEYLIHARRSNPPQRVVKEWVDNWLAQSEHAERVRRAAEQRGDSTWGAPGEAAAGATAGSQLPSRDPNLPQPFFGCALCGGDKDPWNLVTVQVHKWEWEAIVKQIQKAQQEGQTQ